jgi:hypothetical protein
VALGGTIIVHWAMVMGRGLVHPIDLHHSENPSADAELLELMAREFVTMRADVKNVLRELALTRIYPRSSEPPPGATQTDDSAATSTFVVVSLKTEAPEQLAWSVMQGRGLIAQARLQVGDRLDGDDPTMRASFQSDAKRQALRVTMLEEQVHDQLQKNVASFVSEVRPYSKLFILGGQTGFQEFHIQTNAIPRSQASPTDTMTAFQARTNRCPGNRRTRRFSSSTLSVTITWPAVMPVRPIKSATAVG